MSVGLYQPYVVREGDSLSELSYRRGVDPLDVWSAPANASLKASRCHMDLLHPGDLIYLPEPKRTTFFPLKVGSINRFAANPFLGDPYPRIVLEQSSATASISNLLIRLTFPWADPITKLVVNGNELAAARDYFECEFSAFFRAPGEFAGTLEGTVSFAGRSDYDFSLSIATALQERLESIFAQSLNVRAFATAVRARMARQGRTSPEADSFIHNLLLAAFYARQSTLEALEQGVAAGTDWEQFSECVRKLPALLG